jgi:alkanesulfonate monooxygenase SsuD/methylene tetrahydromethanopterin reductase-like flavin-dependent oxidoreductase (luciferase family)
MKTWSTPGPFRWEGEHFHYRYVNPGMRPYQKPHPPVWIPGLLSKNTVEWCARNRIPYVMLATRLEPTRQSFDTTTRWRASVATSRERTTAVTCFKVHVDETEELAWKTARKFLEGPPNIFPRRQPWQGQPDLAELAGHDVAH